MGHSKITQKFKSVGVLCCLLYKIYLTSLSYTSLDKGEIFYVAIYEKNNSIFFLFRSLKTSIEKNIHLKAKVYGLKIVKEKYIVVT